MKKFGPSILAILLFTSIGNIASAAPEASIQKANYSIVIDGQERHYDQSAVSYNDFTLIPLRGVFEDIGADVKYDSAAKKITVIKETNSITLTIGSNTAIANGKPVKFEIPPQMINGKTMVPLRFVTEALGSNVIWDAKAKTISINTKEEQSITKSPGTKDNPSSKISEATTLTYQQALDKALATNLKLKESQADVERSEEVYDESGDKLKYTPTDGSDPSATSALKGTKSAEISFEMAKKQVNITKDSVAYNVKTAYHAILESIKEKELANLTVEHSAMEKNIVNIKAEQGLASDFDKTQAENNYLVAIENQKVAETSLKDAYLKLNQLIGEPFDSRYLLSDLPAFEALEEVDLNYHVTKVLSESPSIWLLEKQVDLAQLDVDLYSFNTGSTVTYKAKEIDVDKAKLTLSDSKKKLDESLRSMYNSIKQLENQYDSLRANFAKAEDNLKLLQTKFDLGMATSLEIFDAKLSVEQLKQQIFNITLKHDELKDTFEKPWVM